MKEITNSPVVFYVLLIILAVAAICILNFAYEVWKAKRKARKPKIEKPDLRDAWGEGYLKSYTNHK